jgi:hypothetical protein
MHSNSHPDDRTASSALDRVAALLTDPFAGRAEVAIEAAELCRLVANDRRRHALRVLADGPISKDDLSRRVAAREYACAPTDLTDAQRKRVFVSLHQTHLPRLADADLVRREDETVVPQPGIDATLEVYRAAAGATTEGSA